MKSQLRTYGLLTGHVVAGTLLLAAVQLSKPGQDLRPAVIFISFLLLNLAYTTVFKLHKDLREYWAIRKVLYLLVGTAAGLLPGLLPVAAASAAGMHYTSIWHLEELSIGSVLVTFLITSWEELWFRNLILNYCSRSLHPFNIALAMGVLFMLLHALNPQISLMKEGPMLFLAGTLLTALYFCYRNIWLPAGVHFGNNMVGSLVQTNIDSHSLYGSQGYIYTAVLLLATIYFLLKLRRTATVIAFS